jgi:ADP-ribosyl-[dinitrogen reductase] hydrolase
MTEPEARSRYRGSLLGLAAGDALGTTLEFKRPGTFEPLTTIVGGGPFGLEPGQWTDDTSMMLCLAESLVEKEGFDSVDQLERYVRWWRNGHFSVLGRCFDIGNTTVAALHRFEEIHAPYCGDESSYAAGNGSLMRLAPVPLFYATDIAEASARAGESSRTTHAAETCVDACRYMGALIAGAAQGLSKEELLAEGFWTLDNLHPEVAAVAGGSFKQRQPPEIMGSGYAVDSLEAALWALWHSDSYAEGALLAVNLGDDADTTGAVYGQLAGAIYGEASIPAEWRELLAMRETIEGFADRLYELSRR